MTVRHWAQYIKFTVECLEQGALSGPHLAYQIDKIALLDSECNVAQDKHVLLAHFNVSVIYDIHQRYPVLFLVALNQLGSQLLNAVSF
jgi:hypothetical protein